MITSAEIDARVCKLIASAPGITSIEITRRLGLKPAVTRLALRRLKSAGAVIHTGATRAVRYTIAA